MTGIIKRGITHGVLVVSSLMLVCAVIELCSRLVGYAPQVIPPYLYENHPLTWWTLRPNFHGTVRTPDGLVTYTINAQGIRSPTNFVRHPDGAVQRIFLIGDSFTFGQGIDEAYTFAHVLQDALRAQKLNVDVINLGVSGFGTMHAYYRLTEYAELLGRPEMVIYAFSSNDPIDNIAGKKEVVNGIRIDAYHQHKRLLAFIGHLHFNVRLVAFVLSRLYPLFNPRLEKAQALGAQAIAIEDREDFKATAAYLARMRDWTTAHHTQFMALINSRSQYTAPLHHLLEQTGTVALDAERIFAQYNPTNQPIHLKEGHWNAIGHACIARGIEACLFQQRWINKSSFEQ